MCLGVEGAEGVVLVRHTEEHEGWVLWVENALPEGVGHEAVGSFELQLWGEVGECVFVARAVDDTIVRAPSAWWRQELGCR